MSDESTERIMILLQAKDADMKREFDKIGKQIARQTKQWEQSTSAATRKMDADLKSAGASALSFAKNFAVGFAVGAVTSLASTNLRGIIRDLADLQDAADRVGMSTTGFQELQVGMKLAGVDAANFGTAIEKFVSNIGDAARGTGKLNEILLANGIAIRNNAGEIRPTSELLRDYADLIKRVPEEATRLSLMEDAFGKSGKALVLAMSEGRAGIDKMSKSAEDAGLVMNETLIRKAAELDDRFDILNLRAKIFFETIVLKSVDAMDALSALMAGVPLDVLMAEIPAESIFGARVAQNLRDNAVVLEKAKEDVADVGAAYGVLLSEAGLTADALRDVGDAMLKNGDYENSDIFLSMADKMEMLVISLKSGKISGNDFQRSLKSIVKQAGETKSGLDKIDTVTMNGLVSELNRANAVIDAMAARAAAALAEVLKLASVSATGAATGGAGASVTGGGEVTITPKRNTASSGGGGKSKTNSEAARWYEQTRTEAEKYEADLADLDRLLKQGAVSNDTYARGLELIREKYDLASDASKLMQDVGGSALDRLIDGTADLKEALIDMIKEFLKARLLQQLGGAPGSSLGSTIVSSLVGGLAGKRANGGAVTAGKAYLVGENGPEPFIPQQSGAIVPHMKGGTNSVAVQVTGGDLVLTDSGQIAARIRVTAQQSGMMAVQSVRQQLPAWQRQLATDGTL